MYSIIPLLLLSVSLTKATVLPRADVTLAVKPVCGSFGGSPKDVKGTLPALSAFKTIVTFGDSYSDGGKYDGSALNDPVLHPPNPSAGGRCTNGPIWAEYLANTTGAVLMDYAVNGAVIDDGQWAASAVSIHDDLLTQTNTYISQYQKNDPATTLHILFFGIEDYVNSIENGDSSLSNQAGNIAYTILRLSSSPVFGKNFLVIDNHGRGTETPAGAAYKTELFKELSSLSASSYGLSIGFIDLSTVWNGVLGTSPGAAAFGYTSTNPCLASPATTVGSCVDPDHAFYWFPLNPTTVTHRIMSDYIQAVWVQC